MKNKRRKRHGMPTRQDTLPRLSRATRFRANALYFIMLASLILVCHLLDWHHLIRVEAAPCSLMSRLASAAAATSTSSASSTSSSLVKSARFASYSLTCPPAASIHPCTCLYHSPGTLIEEEEDGVQEEVFEISAPLTTPMAPRTDSPSRTTKTTPPTSTTTSTSTTPSTTTTASPGPTLPPITTITSAEPSTTTTEPTTTTTELPTTTTEPPTTTTEPTTTTTEPTTTSTTSSRTPDVTTGGPSSHSDLSSLPELATTSAEPIYDTQTTPLAQTIRELASLVGLHTTTTIISGREVAEAIVYLHPNTTEAIATTHELANTTTTTEVYEPPVNSTTAQFTTVAYESSTTAYSTTEPYNLNSSSTTADPTTEAYKHPPSSTTTLPITTTSSRLQLDVATGGPSSPPNSTVWQEPTPIANTQPETTPLTTTTTTITTTTTSTTSVKPTIANSQSTTDASPASNATASTPMALFTDATSFSQPSTTLKPPSATPVPTQPQAQPASSTRPAALAAIVPLNDAIEVPSPAPSSTTTTITTTTTTTPKPTTTPPPFPPSSSPTTEASRHTPSQQAVSSLNNRRAVQSRNSRQQLLSPVGHQRVDHLTMMTATVASTTTTTSTLPPSQRLPNARRHTRFLSDEHLAEASAGGGSEAGEVVAYCRNVQNPTVLREAIKGFRGHQVSYFVIDSCRLPPFPNDLFQGIDVRWLEMSNSTVQFHDNFLHPHHAHLHRRSMAS